MIVLKRTIILFIFAYTFYQLQMSEEIEHRMVTVNGIQMHIAEEGEGPVVLLIHGFPELWYTWRHQMASLAAHGYRAVAPDLRGYGDTEAPISPSNYTSLDVVGDLIGLINLLGQDKVFVVGHDWGAMIAWYLSLYRPDKVKALVTLSVPFQPRNPLMKPIQSLRAAYGDEYYIIRFQEPGEMEAEFARVGTAAVLKTFLSYHNPAPFNISKEKGFPSTDSDTLPSWLSEADLNYYTTKYEQKGFTGGLNYYRALDLNWKQKLEADRTMEWRTSESTCEVYCGGQGLDVQWPWSEGIHTWRWTQEICAWSRGSSSIGRRWSLHQRGTGRRS